MLESITTPNGYLPGSMRAKAKNLLRHGQITAFPFGNGFVPFSIFFSVKTDNASTFNPGTGYPPLSVFIDCHLRGDQVASPYLLSFNTSSEWTKVEITKIANTAHNNALLSQMDFYYMAEVDPNTGK